MKDDSEKSLLEVCPEGKVFLSIEYESDCDQQINLYEKKWLESEPTHTNSAAAFF